MGTLDHIYPVEKSILEPTASCSPLPDGDEPSSTDDVHEEFLASRGRQMSTAKKLELVLGLLVLSGIFLTTFVALPRWTSVTSSSTPPNTMVGDDDFYIPEGYMDQVLAHHGIFSSLKKPAAADNDENDAAATNSTSSSRRNNGGQETHKLSKRAYPEDQLCGPYNREHWIARLCETRRGPQAWKDICLNPGQPDLHYQENCPEGTYCSPYQDEDEDRHIVCLDINPPLRDNIGRGVKRPRSGQYGYREVPQPPPEIGRRGAQRLETVKLLIDIPHASTSARFVDDDKKFVIAPNNEMNANVYGYKPKICQSGINDFDRRDCLPTMRWTFTAGNVITFNFGTGDKQTGIFFYSIYGNS